ncbi:MAG TPA: T9SS type A sorting domain-containing protein, partial [Ferruginibacter sp.]|nr:T9SS type A sorting domain-containing protein [Ferruginibacter sp.]
TTVSLLNNPVTSNITLDFLSGSRSNIRVRMVDMSGRLVSTKTLSVQSGAQRLQLDIPSGTSSGLYVLQLTDESGQVIFKEKIIKL